MRTLTAALAILILGFASVKGQNRPFYAGRPSHYPTLLSRFGESEGEGGGLSNRVGETGTVKPLVFAGGSVVDEDLVNRVASWPRDKQPFWYVNNMAIRNHLNNPEPRPDLPPQQSSFLSG